MNEYSLVWDKDSVSICMCGECEFFKGFMDIYVSDGEIKSPFNTVLEARLFATVIIDLLKTMDKTKERLK